MTSHVHRTLSLKMATRVVSKEKEVDSDPPAEEQPTEGDSTAVVKHGGFDCVFVKAPSQDLHWECPLCLQILRDPYQAPCCGNSFCRICIERVNVDNNKPCPTCNKKDFSTYPNKGLQRTLYQYEVYCSHKQEGCEWKGELGQLDNHLNLSPEPDRQLEGCEYSEINCLSCNELSRRIDIINKAEDGEHCPKCPFSCNYCHDYEATYEDVVSNHYSKCSQYSSTQQEESQGEDDSQARVRRRTGAGNSPQQQQQQQQEPQLEQQKDDRQQVRSPICSRSCMYAVITLLAMVIISFGVLVYSFQVNKCNWVQPLVQKCEQHCNSTMFWYECYCDSGYQLNSDGGWRCDDVDECSEGLHHCAHSCHNTVGSYTCSCNSGYTLNNDGLHCDDINECADGSHRCEHDCHNTDGSYTCTCRGNYYQVDKIHCESWREHIKSIPDQEKADWFQKWLDDSTTLDILLTGKTGAGKSTLINGLLGKKVVATKENVLEADTMTVSDYSCTKNGVQIRVWDSPGLQDRSSREDDYIAEMKRKCHSVDFVLYCIRMDETRLYNDDYEAIMKLKNAFGKAFWDRTFFILTFANRIEPPRKDQKLSKKDYFTQRLNAWVKTIRSILVETNVSIDLSTIEKRVIPAGFEDLHLPDRKYWLSKLWLGIFELADKKAQGSLLKMSLSRMIQEEKAKEKDFEDKETYRQPLVSDKSWWDTLWSWIPFFS